MIAFVLAYVLRFETGLIQAPKGYPPFAQYLNVLPLIGILVPFAFQVQGIYRLRRGRTRVDDFFAVFVGSILAVVLGVVTTLYIQAYYVPDELKARGAFEISQLVWAIFLVLNVSLTYATRELVREALERRWRQGIGLKRVLVAGAGELGRVVVDKLLEHRELGYKVVGFVDDRAGGDHLGYRGLPLLGTLAEAGDILQRERIDQLYVALPLDEHMKMVSLVESANREIVEVKVVPDLVQVIALKRATRRARRHPHHQHPRRPAPRLQQRAEAGDRRRRSRPRRCSLLAPVIATVAVEHPPDVARRGVLPPGAHGPRRPLVLGLEVPLDVRRRRARDRAGLGARGRPAVHADRPLPAAHRTSTSCRSSGTCCRATCRSSARGPSGRSSSSSSSSACRSTCCATR